MRVEVAHVAVVLGGGVAVPGGGGIGADRDVGVAGVDRVACVHTRRESELQAEKLSEAGDWAALRLAPESGVFPILAATRYAYHD